MFRLLLPLVLGLVGTAGGVAAALYLAPTAEDEPAAMPDLPADAEVGPCGPPLVQESAAPAPAPRSGATEFAKIASQFVVPLVKGGEVQSLVVMSLTIEMAEGTTDAVYEREPRLRTAFLQSMFNHANSGGFEGNFTTSRNLEILREVLMTQARTVLGPDALDVLITDLVRQDNAG